MRTQQEIELTFKVYKQAFEHAGYDLEQKKTAALVMSTLQWVLGSDNSIQRITPLIQSHLNTRNN